MFHRYLILLCVVAASMASAARAQDSQAAGAQAPAAHTVAAGESLFVIAQRYGMTVAELKELNGLTGDIIHPGQVLRLSVQVGQEDGANPDAAAADAVGEAEEDPAEPNEELLAELAPAGVSTYTAKTGDTFYSIAAEQGTKAYVLLALNGNRRAPLEQGMTVVVPSTGQAATYEVRPGDTLSRIAEREGTSVAALRQANDLRSDLLLVGQTLIIPAGGVIAAATEADSVWFAVGRVTIASDSNSGIAMAGGEPYDSTAFTVGHRFLPLGTVLIVENPATGRASFARVADRAPAEVERLLEITPALSHEIGAESDSFVRIRLVE